jgi:DNA-directed RNA polymerase I, II, and III subunit RPABC1
MPRLTEVQRGQAIALQMQGQRQQQVALQFGVNVSTIERLVRRLRDTRRVADRPRRGRPRVMTPRQDMAIQLAHLRNHHVTATETALITVGNHNLHIHPKTVRNRLREFGLRARRPYIGFPLTRAHRKSHMAWLAAHGPG